ncbi:hypothetical protein DPEC_G00376210 [Dallia pectoralis]|nr:hypothetical protein DPEC_G00376210 [Dallia pectoralis]
MSYSGSQPNRPTQWPRGPKERPFARHMHLDSAHHHHLDALLATIACYIDPTVKSLHDYPVRHVQSQSVAAAAAAPGSGTRVRLAEPLRLLPLRVTGRRQV